MFDDSHVLISQSSLPMYLLSTLALLFVKQFILLFLLTENVFASHTFLYSLSPDSQRWPTVGRYRVDVASFETVALPELEVICLVLTFRLVGIRFLFPEFDI